VQEVGARSDAEHGFRARFHVLIIARGA